MKHVRNRAQKSDFYLDKQLAGTVTESPYELPVESVEPRQHHDRELMEMSRSIW